MWDQRVGQGVVSSLGNSARVARRSVQVLQDQLAIVRCADRYRVVHLPDEVPRPIQVPHGQQVVPPIRAINDLPSIERIVQRTQQTGIGFGGIWRLTPPAASLIEVSKNWHFGKKNAP